MTRNGQRLRSSHPAHGRAMEPLFSGAVVCGLSAAVLQLAWAPTPPCAAPEEGAQTAPASAPEGEDAGLSPRRGLALAGSPPFPRGGAAAHPSPPLGAIDADPAATAPGVSHASGHPPAWLAALHLLRGPPLRRS